jgi:DDE superfamily endonuclease
MRYQNRKGGISQNVLAVCLFDLKFIYVMSGWEGSTADSWLWHSARLMDLSVLVDHYYLRDAGFPLCDALLVPYRGVHYHLKEWEKAKSRHTLPFYSLN